MEKMGVADKGWCLHRWSVFFVAVVVREIVKVILS